MSIRKFSSLQNGDSEATPSSSQKRRRTSYNCDVSYHPDMYIEQNENALCGILDRVTVKNFMCHDHLEFSFGPNINFVQGRNGSGKSAILTAVVVGLGGTVRSTNRGSSIRELVKYGKQTATVEIYIKNGGKDAYKSDVFGESIIVERKIQSTGGGGYKIKAQNGTIVSSKKEEIIRILDHFNLQVENPVTVLNQDMSRSFLNSTDPHDLYKFFLQATQLQQMRDYYSQLESALEISNAIIEDRKGSLDSLHKEVQEHRSRYEFSESLADKRNKLRELRRELIWAKVIEVEKQEEDALQKFEAQDTLTAKLQEKIDTYQKKFEEEEKQHKSFQEDVTQLANSLSEKLNETKAATEFKSKAKAEVKTQQAKLYGVEKSAKDVQHDLNTLKEAVENYHGAAQNDWAAKRDAKLKKISDLKTEIGNTSQDIKTQEHHLGNLRNTVHQKKKDQSQKYMEEKAVFSRRNKLEQDLRELQGQQNNVFTVYGRWVPDVLKQIDIAHQRGMFSAKPVGPLGAFIKLRDQKWGHVAEAIMRNRISSFCVNNQSDFRVLQQILSKINFGNAPKPMIIVSRFRERVHDVSQFEVQSDRYPSLWSVLDVSDTVIANTLIDQLQVESILLIPTAQEAGQILKDQRTVPRNCKVAYTLNRDMYYPDPNYRIYSGRGQEPIRYLQVSVEQKIKDLEDDIAAAGEELIACKNASKELQAETKATESEIHMMERKKQSELAKLKELRRNLSELENQDEPAPPDISQLEEDIRQEESKLQSLRTQAAEIKAQLEESEQRFKEAASKVEKLNQEYKKSFAEADRIKENVSQCEQRTNRLLQTVEGYKKKMKDIVGKKKDLEKELKAAKDVKEKETEKAKNFEPRFDTNRSFREVNDKYKALEARLNKEEAKRGDPVEIAQKYKEVQQRYVNIVKDIEGHSHLIKVINQSLEKRRKQYDSFRRFTSIMIKSHFRNMLTPRNLHGTLHFDFAKGILTMSVVKLGSNNDANTIARSKQNSMNNKKHGPQQTLAMMSGGERSFCTVSFILALWEVMESPIRILDEFDVFMDIVARKQSMDMMIHAAKAKTQYIYLTPLELNKADLANVHIYRMPDPERREED